MIRSQVGSCFIDVAQGCICWLVFCRNLFPVGTFTVLNQRMFPRSQYISTSITFRMPCGSPFRNLDISHFKNGWQHLKHSYFRHNHARCALHPLAKASGLSAPGDKFALIGSTPLLLGWLGISIGMHAFPSNQDMLGFVEFVNDSKSNIFIHIFAKSISILFRIVNAMRVIWFDAIYAILIACILPTILLIS